MKRKTDLIIEMRKRNPTLNENEIKKICDNNSKPLRVNNLFERDINLISARRLERGLPKQETSPSKITKDIINSPYWKKILEDEGKKITKEFPDLRI